ncbi:MAG: hypothetical protein A2452_10370 [Candidatus Firestonebacteria bacterium RIFOXYC2_FULL_39_67]|nr:MAG: hypothetical protein A2536_06740 [Candidatus Firestonebacteria bacterium RIFOXYD2_FULL_39_29]OGF54306.1 MAG: hypothetical protein A2452_10370 [Candidatus Firestonebacteria bacterium RIFOXYC2_FULL_39_67]OGF57879.1 MAG: hypothetical protein A2497_00670 [Candidatus Firestonebacteria bacterium RifOxyC12_full_39_7]
MRKKIRLGILGFRRGAYLANIFKQFPGVEISAGCDIDPQRKERFKEVSQTAEVYADFEEFLNADFDVLVLASDCHVHGYQAIQAMKKGKDIFSEVTAFHTLGEGVELSRTVEKTKRKYMMAENVNYFPHVLEMERLYNKSNIGKFVHGECEYVHDIRYLLLRPDGSKYWRTWFPPIYYCTHSIGPILKITGERPVSVTGMIADGKVLPDLRKIDMELALVKTDKNSTIKILCGYTLPREPVSRWFCMYGTKGMMESSRWEPEQELYLYEEKARKYRHYTAKHRGNKVKDAHLGADYLTIYNFLNAYKNNRKMPIDIYKAADMTLPGILAHRSSLKKREMAIPDFREESIRKQHEYDFWSPDPDTENQLVMKKKYLNTHLESRCHKGYNIRAFKQGDEEGWIKLVNECVGSNYDLNSAQKSLFKSDKFDPKGLFFAVKGKEIAGTACAWSDKYITGKKCTLHMVAVYPKHRGKGLGYSLSLAVLDYFRKRSSEEVYLRTDDFRLGAIKSYLDLGFEPVPVNDLHKWRWSKVLEKLK